MKRGPAGLAQRDIRTLYSLGALGGLSDAELLEIFLTRGEDDARDSFAVLVRRHGPMVLSACRRMLPGSHDAEDAFQATFLILVRRASAIGRRELLANWLYGVAVRTAKEVKRRNARQLAREMRMSDLPRVESVAVEDRADLLHLLDEELNRLPQRYRVALVTCELEGKSRCEAAMQLGVPEGTLSSHLARGRKLLRERLGRRGVDLGILPLAGLAPQVTHALVSESLAGSTVRLAPGGLSAGAVPATVMVLAERVLPMMLIPRVAVIVTSIVAIGLSAVITGAVVFAKPDEPQVIAPVIPEAKTPTEKPESEQGEAIAGGSRIQGIVVGESGKPLPGVEVRVIGAKEQRSRGVTSASGRFDFPVEEQEREGGSLLASSPDRTLQRIADYGYRLGADSSTQDIRIVCRQARQVCVRVVDRDGRPVTDVATVFLSQKCTIAEGRTDADGRWSVRVPADASDWAFVARKAGAGFDFASAWNPENRASTKPLPEQLTLALDGARTVRVKAVDRNDHPIAGVNVGLSSMQKASHEWFTAWFDRNTDLWPVTGKDGIAILNWLPEHVGGGLALSGYVDGHYLLQPAWIAGDEPVDSVTFKFLPFETLSGRVTHADGRPARDIQVSVSGHGPADGRGGNAWNGSARTDADGRYRLKALSEQVYVVAVKGKDGAAPYRADIVVRAGKPVEGVDFVLGRPTRVHGRLTIGEDGELAPSSSVLIRIDRDITVDGMGINGRSFRTQSEMHEWVPTDDRGEYEIYLGPGEYRMTGPGQREFVTLTIPTENPPAEITQEIRVSPEPTIGPLALQVLDSTNRPVAGAVVNGKYPSRRGARWFKEQTSDDEGRLQSKRTHTPLMLHARSVDGRLAGVARLDAKVAEFRFLVAPVATATGCLLDPDGKALAKRSVSYGIRIHSDEEEDAPFFDAFGGTVKTDAQGRFTLTGLVPGQTYQVVMELAEGGGRGVATVTPTGSGTIDLGDRRVDTVLNRPFVPPTPEKRAANAFASQGTTSPIARKEAVLLAARRDYTRPLLLFGRPSDSICIDLFRAFAEKAQPTQGDGKSKGEIPLPGDLRWEFELASLDRDQPETRLLAEGLGITTNLGGSPLLVVLADDGSVAAKFSLTPDQGGKLDRRALSTFLLGQKTAARDAETMLAEALAKAKAEDKCVFLIFSASWCGPCRGLAQFLDSQKAELERHYVFVKPDMSRDDHAEALRDRYPESKGGGIPWFAILDATGKEVITSNMKNLTRQSGSTNVGYPLNRKGLEHFLKMLKQTAPRLSGDKLAEFGKLLANEK